MFTPRARALQIFVGSRSSNSPTVTATVQDNCYPFPPSILRPDVGPQWRCHLATQIRTDDLSAAVAYFAFHSEKKAWTFLIS